MMRHTTHRPSLFWALDEPATEHHRSFGGTSSAWTLWAAPQCRGFPPVHIGAPCEGARRIVTVYCNTRPDHESALRIWNRVRLRLKFRTAMPASVATKDEA